MIKLSIIEKGKNHSSINKKVTFFLEHSQSDLSLNNHLFKKIEVVLSYNLNYLNEIGSIS